MTTRTIPIALLPGERLGDPFDQQSLASTGSAIVTVNAGDGVGATAPTVILSKQIPPASRIYVDKLSLRVVDMAAYDQLYFGIRHNAAMIFPYHKISGEQVAMDHFVSIDRTFDSGLFEIVGINISGTTEDGASSYAVAIRTLARLYAYTIR